MQDRIVGGLDSLVGEWPWQVDVQVKPWELRFLVDFHVLNCKV